MHVIKQNATGFVPLIALCHQRLEISSQVAFAKWHSGQPVADPPEDPREQQVVAAASEEARARGVPLAWATSFFLDQIEASKLVQFVLMATWRRQGAPGWRCPDLVTELRPQLDALRPRLIEELARLCDALQGAEWKAQLAREIGGYADDRQLQPLYTIALDRGLARLAG